MPIIAIFCAIPQEVQPFRELLSLKEEPQSGSFLCFTGSYADKTIALALTGIGKAHAAAATQYVIDRYKPETILSCGSAGGLDERCRIGDIIIASRTLQHDYGFLLPEGFVHFGLHLRQKNRKRKFFTAFEADPHLLKSARKLVKAWNDSSKVFSGPLVTGDQTIFSAESRALLSGQFEALAVDMESAAIAQICKINMVPFLAIRSISDLADEAVALDRSKIDPQAFAEFSSASGMQKLSLLSKTIRYLAQNPGLFRLAQQTREHMNTASAHSAQFCLQLLEVIARP